MKEINMKKFALLTAMAVGGLLTANNVQASFSSTNLLLTQIKLTAFVSSPETLKTNSNGTIITVSVKTTKVKVITQDILNILGTEFSANYDGDLLAYNLDNDDFVVADANGAIVKDVHTNLTDSSYFFDTTNFVDQTEADSAKEVEKTATTNITASVTVYESDYGIRYADGEGNDFHVSGLLTEKAKLVETPAGNTLPSASLVISPAQGGGTFFDSVVASNVEAVITGSVTIKGKNLTGD